MNPDDALVELLQELANDRPNRERIVELLAALHEWVRLGGSLPQITFLIGEPL